MVEEFLNYLQYELRRSPETVESYRCDLGHCEVFFKALNDHLDWETIDSDVIRDWMESMIEKGNKATSVSRRLSAVRSLYRFALAHRLVEQDPAHKRTKLIGSWTMICGKIHIKMCVRVQL